MLSDASVGRHSTVRPISGLSPLSGQTRPILLASVHRSNSIMETTPTKFVAFRFRSTYVHHSNRYCFSLPAHSPSFHGFQRLHYNGHRFAWMSTKEPLFISFLLFFLFLFFFYTFPRFFERFFVQFHDDNKTPIERMMHNVQSWYYLNFRKGTSRNQEASEPLARLYELETRFFDGVVRVFFIFIEKKKSVGSGCFAWLVMMVKTNEGDIYIYIGINEKFVHLFLLQT